MGKLSYLETPYAKELVEQPFYVRMIQSLFEITRLIINDEELDHKKIDVSNININYNLQEIPFSSYIENNVETINKGFFSAFDTLDLMREDNNYYRVLNYEVKKSFNMDRDDNLHLASFSNHLTSSNPLYNENKTITPWYYLYLTTQKKHFLEINCHNENILYHKDISKIPLEDLDHFINDTGMARKVILFEDDCLDLMKIVNKFPDTIFITTLNRNIFLKRIESEKSNLLNQNKLSNLIFVADEITIDQEFDFLTTEQKQLALKITDVIYRRDVDRNNPISGLDEEKVIYLTKEDIEQKKELNKSFFDNAEEHLHIPFNHPEKYRTTRPKTKAFSF